MMQNSFRDFRRDGNESLGDAGVIGRCRILRRFVIVSGHRIVVLATSENGSVTSTRMPIERILAFLSHFFPTVVILNRSAPADPQIDFRSQRERVGVMNELWSSRTLLLVCAFMMVGLGRDPSSVQGLSPGSPGSTGTGTPGHVAAADSSDSPPVVSDKLVSAADQAPAAPEAPAEEEQSAVVIASDADTNEYSERTVGTEESEAIDASEPTLEEWTEYLESVGYFDNSDSGARGGCGCNLGGDCCGGFCVC